MVSIIYTLELYKREKKSIVIFLFLINNIFVIVFYYTRNGYNMYVRVIFMYIQIVKRFLINNVFVIVFYYIRDGHTRDVYVRVIFMHV